MRAFLRRGETPPAPDPSAPQRSMLISVPFFHATGCFAILNPMLASGAKLVMMHRWDPVRAFELIEREKVRLFYACIPAHFGVLNPDRKDAPQSLP